MPKMNLIPLRSGGAVRVVHVDRAGDHHKEDGPGTGPLRGLLFRLLHRGDFRSELADVSGARLTAPFATARLFIATFPDRDSPIA